MLLLYSVPKGVLQLPDALVDAKVPSTHGSHDPGPSAPTTEKKPGPHAMHEVASSAAKVPAGQGMQKAAPTSAAI